MTKKIMLIKPAYETDAVWDTVRTSQPLGLWWIGSLLKERAHEVRILDETVRAGALQKKVLFRREVAGAETKDEELHITYANFQAQKMQDFAAMTSVEFVDKYSSFFGEKIVRTMVRTGNTLEETLAEVSKMNPNIVGIPVFASCNYPSALSLAKAVKESFPEVKIVMGGQHVTALPDEVLQHDFIDYAVTGDAVQAMVKIVENEVLTRGRIHGGVLDLSNFPLLDMELMAENEYPLQPTHTYDTKGRKAVDYMFSKGCYRSCEFCVAGERENKISSTQLGRIDEQLQRFVDAGIEEIVVQDDAFLFKPERNLNEYLNLMKKHGLYWQDNGGIEFEGLTPAVIDQFLEYQLQGQGKINSLYVPLNPRTGQHSESALKDMRERFAEHFPHVKQLREAGIYVCTSEIIGYPGQSLESMNDDIKLHQELVNGGYVDKSMTFVTSTLPGTKLYRGYLQHIVNLNDWAAYSNFVPQSRTDKVQEIKSIERITIERNQQMNKVQKSYPWGSAFPNF
ncbi:cobalamin-dependent protein [Candidatus Woesearchaeota archaeon]|nr:cobalamin-dependent protein [Candidatus Woesearchaeota archaeon]